MAKEIRMPMWGMGMLEGTVVEWYKQEGDEVESGEPLAEIEAAKTVEDLLSPAAGVLQRIVVAEGMTVPVQEVLAILTTEDADGSAPAGEDGAAAAEPGAQSAPPTASEAAVRNVVPRACLRARELGVDLTAVTGTGPGGRITVADVENTGRRSAPPDARGAGEPGAGHTVPLTGMRGTIAKRMLGSLQTMAQLTLVRTVDVTRLVAHRAAWSDQPQPTYTDYLVKAVALALRRHPGLNATVDDDRIRLFDEVHIGVATALDEGLIVPVVSDADTAPLDAIARTTVDLVGKVRAGTYGRADVTGSTFTISSLGGQGVDAFTPIVNPPAVTILGLGRILEQPVRDGDGIAWRQVMTLSLTIDHRAVDGAPGAASLQTIGGLVADPDALAG